MAKADPKKAAPAAPKFDLSQLGVWAFLLGALVAVIMAVGSTMQQAWASNAWLVFALVVLGLVIGVANIKKLEPNALLMPAIALLVAKTANLSAINTLIPFVGTFLEAAVSNAITLVAPAAVIVALKSVYTNLKD
ncbi:MAG: hypothetical protein AABX74_03525 [Nanoarchaeota archaeon]